MKQRITSYTFNAAAKTISFDDFTTIALEQILVITNATDSTIIYNFADPSLGGTVATNVLTLEYDTTSMSDTDKLLIYYDLLSTDPAAAYDDPAVKIQDGGNVISIDDGGGSITVDGTVTASIAAGATTIAKAEDAASADGDVGVPAMAIQKATPADTAGTDGDYAMLQMSGGRLWIAGRIEGDVANDAINSGNPLQIGGRAATALPTAVADGDRVAAQFTKTGKQVIVPALREMLGNQQTTITSSIAETTIVTADATYNLDLYGLIITNSSSSNCKVTIKDSTAGTTRFVIMVPANDTAGFIVDAGCAHKQASANNNWTATCGTSVASIDITAMYVKNL